MRGSQTGTKDVGTYDKTPKKSKLHGSFREQLSLMKIVIRMLGRLLVHFGAKILYYSINRGLYSSGHRGERLEVATQPRLSSLLFSEGMDT